MVYTELVWETNTYCKLQLAKNATQLRDFWLGQKEVTTRAVFSSIQINVQN